MLLKEGNFRERVPFDLRPALRKVKMSFSSPPLGVTQVQNRKN